MDLRYNLDYAEPVGFGHASSSIDCRRCRRHRGMRRQTTVK